MTLNDPFDDCHTRRLVIPLGWSFRVLGLFFLNLFDRVVALDIRSFFFFFSAMSSWLSVQQKWAQSMVWPFKIVNTSVSHSIFQKSGILPSCKKDFLASFPLVFLPELIQVLKRNNKNQVKIVCFFSLKRCFERNVLWVLHLQFVYSHRPHLVETISIRHGLWPPGSLFVWY
jgi:hypothetical protein